MLMNVHGQRLVIDYKTRAHPGSTNDAFIDQEAQRFCAVRRYTALAARINNTPVHMALYFPLLGVFRELAELRGFAG